ncbi:hypothetical protein SAMN00017405_0597 [Desulfonispora thiosulfatigenes DSM 11270]|uniref:5-bromo-4-chloroindolyl phosphate hydrolysis protein n=1 Tax=Desulfonispora thiosulfatigenes DSM 11270 TaxID=656914 RepID=A0A1W1V7J7_DESTI|nr:hypothetical protein [Desulfonispora thiosulfatigenes]SMB89338.1 hypothetical protein SAMN00017405_0597 [Desulfonispora thiosulfatigenes DSM 11270]
MRSARVRGRTNIDETASWYIPLILVFLAGAIGILFGSLVGKISTPIMGFASLIFLALIFIALVITWAINRNLVLVKNELLKDGWKNQHNAFSMLINELQQNLEANSYIETSNKAFESLRHENMLFPPLIYENLLEVYKRLESLKDVSNDEFKDIIANEMDLASLIYNLQEYQQKIRKHFVYI